MKYPRMTSSALCATLAFAAYASVPNRQVKTKEATPNYASTLLPPYEGTDNKPSLFAVWKAFPIVVGVIDDGTLDNSVYLAIRAGAEEWIRATSRDGHNGVHFHYVRSKTYERMQIAVVVGDFPTMDYEAQTVSDYPYRVTIYIQAHDEYGRALTESRIQRVAAHELGHALGIIGHSPNPEDIMSCSESATEVTQADANTLLIAYGGSFKRTGN